MQKQHIWTLLRLVFPHTFLINQRERQYLKDTFIYFNFSSQTAGNFLLPTDVKSNHSEISTDDRFNCGGPIEEVAGGVGESADRRLGEKLFGLCN